jgi:hypothetical protein
VSNRNASALLKIAMAKHDILWSQLSPRVERDEKVDTTVAEALVTRWKDGGACAVVVAAALITLIVDKQRVPA